MDIALLLVGLFAVATVVAIVARRLDFPYTVALVVAGILLGAARVLPSAHLTHELLFSLFLPGLIFEAAFHLDARACWENKLAINALAVPGVVAGIAITAALLLPALSIVPGERPNLAACAVFAALVAATDPIAVVAMFKTLGAPKRLRVIVEGESLLNDGTAVVFFTLVLAAFTGGGWTPGAGLWGFVRIVGLGVLAGLAIGFVVAEAIKRIDDPMLEITLTALAAYGSFIAAERMHASGVIATVCAGLLCGTYAAPRGMTEATKMAVGTFWEYVAFALNSVVFLLLGFEMRPREMAAVWPAVVVAYVVVMVTRAVLVGLVALGLRPTREKLPRGWVTVITWGGLRGALSLVLALSLPEGFPHRDLVVRMTSGVVALSILLQGTTMRPLLKRVGVV